MRSAGSPSAKADEERKIARAKAAEERQIARAKAAEERRLLAEAKVKAAEEKRMAKIRAEEARRLAIAQAAEAARQAEIARLVSMEVVQTGNNGELRSENAARSEASRPFCRAVRRQQRPEAGHAAGDAGAGRRAQAEGSATRSSM